MANLSRTATIPKESCPWSKNRFRQDNKSNKATPPSCPCGSSLVSNSDDFEEFSLGATSSFDNPTISYSIFFSATQLDKYNFLDNS